LIKILDSANATLAIIDNASSAEISEEINGAFTFDFTTVIDHDKSDYVFYPNKAEISDDYFNIMITDESRDENGIYIAANCEHVSYDMIGAVFTAGFTATGLFSAVATTLISAINTAITANFTLGTVEITASQTISINESATGRSILLQLAALYGGELEFDKYAVSLLTQRGADNGVQARYRKNLINASRKIDATEMDDSGNPTISYVISAAELEFESSYIDKGYSAYEHYELGDTLKIIDEDLGIDVSARILKCTFNPLQRMQGTLEIGNYTNDITDTITTITTTTVSKDSVYNGCSIGPENGFVAERSDSIVKTEMNATNGIEIDLKVTATASYTAVFYVQVDTATGTAKLYLAGDAVFTGDILASTIEGSTIIGSNIMAGTTSLATAPFSATESGAVTCDNITITGGIFNIGTGTDTMQFNTDDGLFLGATSVSTAPFRASMSGAVTASNLNMTGGSITAGSITITSNVTVGNNIYLGTSTASVSKALVFASGASFSTFEDFVGWTGLDITASSIRLGTDEITAASPVYFTGTYAFSEGDSGTIYTSGSYTITVTNGLITHIA
jgi:hypothetical protein